MRRKVAIAVAVVAAIVNEAGCAPQTAGPTTEDVAQLSSELKNVNAHLNNVESVVSGMNSRLGAVESKQETHEWSTAYFDPTDSRYQRVDAQSGVGSFAVSVQNVRQYGDGVKVTLDLGNLTDATFSGADLTLKYGPRPPPTAGTKWWQAYPQWSDELKTKDEQVVATLYQGRWNPVTVVLPEIDQAHFGYLQVSITTNEIQLYK